MPWKDSLPDEIVTPGELLDTIEAVVIEAKAHGLVPPLIGNCLRSKAPDENPSKLAQEGGE